MHGSCAQVIVIRESGDDRPLSAVFTDTLQRAILTSAAEHERYALGSSPQEEEATDDAQGPPPPPGPPSSFPFRPTE